MSEPGRSLSTEDRRFFEPKFAHDFSRVRLHTGDDASGAALALNASAFAFGRHIVFGAGQAGNRSLLAHELAHVAQSGTLEATLGGNWVVASEHDPAEHAAGAMAAAAIAGRHAPVPAHAGAEPVVRRKLAVEDPKSAPAGAPAGTTNESIVGGYVSQLCSGFAVSSGKIRPTAGTCPLPKASSKPVSCGCLCDMHRLTNNWTIKIDDNAWPHTDPAARRVVVHSPFSGASFGAWTGGPGEHRTNLDNAAVLGHELCGHGHLDAVAKKHPATQAPRHGGRVDHDETIKVENAISTERGAAAADLRGLHGTSVHHGESFARFDIRGFGYGADSIPAAAAPSVSRAAQFVTGLRAASSPALIDVLGHDDSAGAAVGQQAVSERRAKSVQAEMVKQKVDPALFLAVVGKGAAQCLPASNPADCRRVEVFVFGREGASETHK